MLRIFDNLEDKLVRVCTEMERSVSVQFWHLLLATVENGTQNSDTLRSIEGAWV